MVNNLITTNRVRKVGETWFAMGKIPVEIVSVGKSQCRVKYLASTYLRNVGEEYLMNNACLYPLSRKEYDQQGRVAANQARR